MIVSTARFETAHGPKYLQQLCKHFAHKVAVSHDASSGHVALPPGPARLNADATGLTLEISAEDDTGLARAKYIIEDHLKRFAFREEPGPLTWTIREG
ncbi:DUF2218 domain-containing protein [Pseudooceanicola aestuarii]|uniref:DUF2218 domain-containing protein n=1 Tax=Pseudooceanicola aestuarii TaxID=2697319 RepID=UPI001952C9AE|nr:DUF2218 domain-containing protein [Pseudooceanicola aestuarii]